jgi:hypothetical protein
MALLFALSLTLRTMQMESLVVKNKQFVVIGPDGSVHVPQDNTFSAAVAMRNDLDDDKDSTPSSTTFSPG